MPKRWRIASHDADAVRALERGAGIPAVVAQMLIARGITQPELVRQFLDPKLSGLADPEELPGTSAAAERIFAAIATQEPVVIYGDYDVDGITGTALLLSCLRMLGANVTAYVPHRLDDGYGLHTSAIEQLAAAGAKLIVTVDCGVACIQQALAARALGVDLIITDHHSFAAELPDAVAVVHPRLPGHASAFAHHCGAGVAFKLAWAICQHASHAKKVSERMKSFLMQAVGLAALGTVADCVPLLGENRIIVKHGLASLRQRPSVGMAALLRTSKIEDERALTSEDVAFSLAPRINAAGRLCQAMLAVELLTTDSAERAASLAEYLGELNGSRDSLERSVYLSANKQAQERFDPDRDSALVLAETGWHAGVIGIVASRLAEKFHRPVVLITFDAVDGRPGTGSARSVPGFDLHAAFEACSEHLVSHGGHAAAAGLKVEQAALDAFRASFCAHAEGMIAPAARVAELRIDAEVPFSALTSAAVEQIERLAPFGHENPRPTLCAQSVTLVEPPRYIGSGDRHLQLRLSQHGIELRAVAFGCGHWAADLSAHSGPLAVAFRPVINRFRGRRNVELHVCDWQAAAGAAPVQRDTSLAAV